MALSTFFDLTHIDGGQANQHIVLNEAIDIMTILIAGRVLDDDLTAPPGGETEGDMYIPTATATGDWATHENELAIYHGGAYVFKTPPEGYRVWIADEDIIKAWDGSAWVAV